MKKNKNTVILSKFSKILPETAEELLAKLFVQTEIVRKKHGFTLISLHLEPENACGYFDFGLYSSESDKSVQKKWKQLSEQLEKNSRTVTLPQGSRCRVSGLFLLSDTPCPPPASGRIRIGRFKVKLAGSRFHPADAPIRITPEWDYCRAVQDLQQQAACRLLQIDMDFAGEPELLFHLDSPLTEEQLPAGMFPVFQNGSILQVRLCPLEYSSKAAE